MNIKSRCFSEQGICSFLYFSVFCTKQDGKYVKIEHIFVFLQKLLTK